MNASRMKAETHWRRVGSAVASRNGSLADLDRVLTGRPSVDRYIREGYETQLRRGASKTLRAAKAALVG